MKCKEVVQNVRITCPMKLTIQALSIRSTKRAFGGNTKFQLWYLWRGFLMVLSSGAPDITTGFLLSPKCSVCCITIFFIYNCVVCFPLFFIFIVINVSFISFLMIWYWTLYQKSHQDALVRIGVIRKKVTCFSLIIFCFKVIDSTMTILETIFNGWVWHCLEYIPSLLFFYCQAKINEIDFLCFFLHEDVNLKIK